VMNHKASRSRTGLVFGTITGLFLGMVGLLSAPSAQGMTVSVCETGFTGDPSYDRECLTRGTREDATPTGSGTWTAVRPSVRAWSRWCVRRAVTC
jgi:hypothetical protein